MKSNRRKEQLKAKIAKKASAKPSLRSKYARKVIEGRTTYSQATKEKIMAGGMTKRAV